VFIENQNPNVKPTNWRAILPHLGYKTETSCNVGIIKLQNQQFILGENGKIAFSDRLTRIMEQVEGRDLDIYWIDGNDGQVLKALVYLRGSDRCICEAVAKPSYNRARIEQTPADMEARELMSKYVASIDGYINSNKRVIDKVTVIDNRPKTLNNKFASQGLNKPVTGRIGEVEIMPEIEVDDYDLMPVSTAFKSSLKDRF
jgi:ribosomal protein S17E